MRTASRCLRPAFVAIVLSLILCQVEGADYTLRYDVSKETLQSVTASADHSAEQSQLLNGYKGQKAEQCKSQLKQQDWDADIRNAVDGAKRKIEYIDRLIAIEAAGCPAKSKNCVKLAIDNNTGDLEALEEKSKNSINALKATVLQKQKAFMDKCVSG
ncbi:uncharacterized protein LOC124358750 [Homalodisca vitripennis]|uniref:uncharacterized protein LOC124358750 n=1 Tax=Homalodisca vitripennis TaxID=197043 RepID=UPI001EEAA18A|nr:uncharacterized protein LOC124358750 [Homalodisca vitripennis]KAG8337426.1 hypothetical protein J6590_022460 [Homalodisca vitripennis]